MIRIAVVDDDEVMLDVIYQRLKQLIHGDESIEILRCSRGEMFLSELEKGQKFDILFTDIQMAEMNGIELGTRIHESQPDTYIVFITSYTEYAAESYAIEAYQYILKQDLEYRLPIVANQLIDKINYDNKQYRIMRTEAGKVKIYYKDIILIYKLKGGKYVCFVTMSGEYRERTTIQKVYEELESKAFLMIERGYIVNVRHISKLCGDTVYLENDYQVKISRGKLSEVKRKINCYWGGVDGE